MIDAHSKIQWGTVPAWVSGVLTGGSLILGFYILLRDRRTQERRQALQVAVYYYDPAVPSFDGSWPGSPLIHVMNTSDAPVYDVRARIYSNGPRRYLGEGPTLSESEYLSFEPNVNDATSNPVTKAMLDAHTSREFFAPDYYSRWLEGF